MNQLTKGASVRRNRRTLPVRDTRPLARRSTLPLRLAKDVFSCVADNRVVFLDLRRNQYFCLNRYVTKTATDLLIALKLLGQTAMNETQTACAASDNKELQRVIKALTAKGLLAQCQANEEQSDSLRIPDPENTMLPSGSTRIRAVSARELTAFFVASVKASLKLRYYPIRGTVQSIRAQKQHHTGVQPTDYDALRRLVSTFHQLRPFYIRKYLCLYDSLALMEFLAAYCFYPEWIFGVTAEPFSAHCWVQSGKYVLNDTVEGVRRYTPIMII